MRIELTEAEQADDRGDRDWWLHRDNTLAWRAFGKALDVQVDDPMPVIDAGTWYPQIAERSFSLDEADVEAGHYLSLGRWNCWTPDIWSLDPDCTYISFSVTLDGSFVDLHGWYRPRGASRIIPRDPDDPIPYLTKDGLAPMGLLVGIMRRLIARAGQS